MMFYATRCRRAGFTLIEIMIVIAIIAILAGIAIPNIREARAEAQLAGCRQNILAIVKAMEMATVRCSSSELFAKLCPEDSGNGSFIDDESGLSAYLLENGYLSFQPRCPLVSTTSKTSGSYYTEKVYDNNEVRGIGGIFIGCGNGSGDLWHIVGDKRIRPRYAIMGRSSAPTETCPDGNMGCGWCDWVYDVE